jgi:Amt family ammonium transporter
MGRRLPLFGAPAQAAIDSGDTAWVLISAALVVLMQCLMILCLVSVQWVLFGYSLSFGPDRGSVIGRLEWVGLRTVGMAPNAAYAATIPH